MLIRKRGLRYFTIGAAVLALAVACGGSNDKAEEAPSSSTVLRLMAKFPASFKDEGISFGDRERALDVAEWEGWRTYKELEALNANDPNGAGQRILDYGKAASGVFADSVGLISEAEVWREKFGFDGSAMHRVISMDIVVGNPTAVVCSEGDFNEDVISKKLFALGYIRQLAGGKSYYIIPGEDVRQELQDINPGVPLRMNAVYLEDGVLLRMPRRIDVVEVFEAMDGKRPSLADDEAFRALGESLNDPPSGVLMTRSEVFDPKHTNLKPQLKKQDGWGTLHEWEAMAVGYDSDGEKRWWTFSLFYADPDAAGSDVVELVRRMKGYRSTIPDRERRSLDVGRAYPEQPYVELCDSISSVHAKAGNSSTLTVRCELKPGTPAGAWNSFVNFRDFGFLVP